MTETKNPQAVALGRMGGLARAKNLSDDDRARIARAGGDARWAKERQRPTPEQSVKGMLTLIALDGKPRVLFAHDGRVWYEDATSNAAKRWMAELEPEKGVVGTYGKGATFTEIINDLVAVPEK